VKKTSSNKLGCSAGTQIINGKLANAYSPEKDPRYGWTLSWAEFPNESWYLEDSGDADRICFTNQLMCNARPLKEVIHLSASP
jgi:hypothetical protein